MKNSLTVFCLLTVILSGMFPCFSQTNLKISAYGVVKGSVVDAGTNEHLIGANIYLPNSTIGAASDKYGNYQIQDLPPGKNIIVASMIGYGTVEKEVLIDGGDIVEINFLLNKRLVEVGSGMIDTLRSAYDFPQINVIGEKTSLFSRIPGSANLITSTSLKSTKPVTGNEIFKKVTGINVVDEEGVGLRANIGIRGLDPDRSRTVLMMEDGVPIALAPYGEPEMYYTPAIDRMKRIEILKGSGSISYGPQTIGGVINYITNDPPLQSKFSLDLKTGEGGYFNGQVSYGSTVDNVGFQVNYLYKRADKLGITRFGINDLTAKMKFQTGKNSRLGLKLAFYDETSNSTYVGLTQSMYDSGEYFTIIAPNDELAVRRYSASLTHDLFLSDDSFLRTTVYGYTTTRNWLRQDFSRKPTTNGTNVVLGDTTTTGGAIYMKNSTGNRNRQFEVVGIEPRMHLNFNLWGIKNELESGIRFHFERAFEQRVNGNKADAQSGELKNDEIRTGYASSLFVQDRMFLDETLIFTPGLRLESFNYERDIFRSNYIDTSITNNSNVFAVVPGVGINYNVSNSFSLFAGVHKGFAPPRIKDAITSEGEALELDAESSWNYEIGFRADYASIIYFELTGFRLDFSNQIIPVSESSGGTGTGLVNGGQTLHTGIEAGIRFDLHRTLNSNYIISLSMNSTFVSSTYNADRFIEVNRESINIKENKLPYSPEFLLNGSLNIETPLGLGLHFATTYVSDQFTDELNTMNPSPSGEIGIMPAYLILDLTSTYHIPDINSTIFVSIKNLMDGRYIASRRPQGIKVGLPRLITAGIGLTF